MSKDRYEEIQEEIEGYGLTIVAKDFVWAFTNGDDNSNYIIPERPTFFKSWNCAY